MKIIESVIHYPSADNCQPFRFKWSDDHLEIFHVEERGRSSINFGNIASHLTLGCLVEMICISASGYELKVAREYFLPIRPEIHLAAKLSFKKAEVKPDILLDSLALRRTDRRLFTHKLDEAKLNSDSAVFHSGEISIKTIDPQGKSELIKNIEHISDLIFKVKPYHDDLYKWIRFPVDSRPDGMPLTTLGVGPIKTIAFWLIGFWPLQVLYNWLGLNFVNRFVIRRQILSGSLVLISSKDNSPHGVVEVGCVGVRMWLWLNKDNVGVQPISLPSFFTFAKEKGILSSDLKTSQLSLIDQSDKLLRQEFQLDSDDHPIWLFRVGRQPEGEIPPVPSFDLLDVMQK